MRIILSDRAVKALRKINEPTKSRIRAAISMLPSGDVVRLKRHRAAHRLRVGNWRILFDMYDNGIEITDILPRGSAYKN